MLTLVKHISIHMFIRNMLKLLIFIDFRDTTILDTYVFKRDSR